MYRGATRINLDGKNRIAIPTKYREKILIESSGLLVLTAHIYKCLLLYPQFAWEPIQEKIMNLSSFEKKPSGLQRLLVGFAEDITLDKANRLLIPAELKNYYRVIRLTSPNSTYLQMFTLISPVCMGADSRKNNESIKL